MEYDKLDIDLLALLSSSRNNYIQYRDQIKQHACTDLSWQLVEDIGQWYEQRPSAGSVDFDDFRGWFRVEKHPGWKHEKHRMYGTIIDNVESRVSDPEYGDTTENGKLLHRIRKVATAEEISKELASGRFQEASERMADFLSMADDMPSEDDGPFDLSLEEIVEAYTRYGGLSFRLEDLNRSIGALHKGDFLAIGKRPEVGGTSFMCSEFTHMVHQLPEGKNAVIFNNEEEDYKVYYRLVSSALNKVSRDIYTDPLLVQKEYNTFLGSKRIDLFGDDVSRDLGKIEKVLEGGSYGLIGINVLLKVNGVGRNIEDFDKMERLGTWCRRTAKKYGPVFAIVQADPSAEGIKYPTQNQIYKAKTGFPGETDVLIMMGRTDDDEETRYLNICRNKLPGTMTTDPSLRHGKFEVGFDPETGLFYSKNFR